MKNVWRSICILTVAISPFARAADVATYLDTAEQNDAAAQFRSGARYENGIGVEKNLVQAAAWYKKSAEQGMRPPNTILACATKKAGALKRTSTRRTNG